MNFQNAVREQLLESTRDLRRDAVPMDIPPRQGMPKKPATLRRCKALPQQLCFRPQTIHNGAPRCAIADLFA